MKNEFHKFFGMFCFSAILFTSDQNEWHHAMNRILKLEVKVVCIAAVSVHIVVFINVKK